MSERHVLLLIGFFCVVLAFVLRMIVRHRLREVYAVVWVLVTFLIPAAIVLYPLMERFCSFLGIASVFNFVIFVEFIFCFGLLLHFSILNSGMQRTLKNAVQKIALLEGEIEELARKIEKAEDSTGDEGEGDAQ